MMATWLRVHALIRSRRLPGLLWISIILLVIELGLRFVRLPTLARALGCPLALDPNDAVADFGGTGEHRRARQPFTPDELRSLVDAERVLRRWPPGDTCLRRALLVGCVLRRRRPTLRVGVAKVDGVVNAHAWLDIEGRPLNPMDSRGYQVLRSVDVPTTTGAS